MCGPAGSGKSTYISKKILSDTDHFYHHSSRDTIRFGLVKENEEYFSKEDEVFDLFCEDMNETLPFPILNVTESQNWLNDYNAIR